MDLWDGNLEEWDVWNYLPHIRSVPFLEKFNFGGLKSSPTSQNPYKLQLRSWYLMTLGDVGGIDAAPMFWKKLWSKNCGQKFVYYVQYHSNVFHDLSVYRRHPYRTKLRPHQHLFALAPSSLWISEQLASGSTQFVHLRRYSRKHDRAIFVFVFY